MTNRTTPDRFTFGGPMAVEGGKHLHERDDLHAVAGLEQDDDHRQRQAR